MSLGCAHVMQQGAIGNVTVLSLVSAVVLLQELQRAGELTELRAQLAAAQQTLSSKLDVLDTSQGAHAEQPQLGYALPVSCNTCYCLDPATQQCTWAERLGLLQQA